ncbi:hypothetical protein [Hyperthermus butylicus]|nr:hypothetical protein [Hyperthermus butylicus]
MQVLQRQHRETVRGGYPLDEYIHLAGQRGRGKELSNKLAEVEARLET